MRSFEYDAVASVVVLSVSGMLALLGVVCNGLLLQVLWRINELWGSFTFRLITCAAVGDLVASLTTVGIGMFRLVLGYPGVMESAWYCRVFGFSLFFSHNLSGLLVSLIALDRYLVVKHRQRLHPAYTWVFVTVVALTFGAALACNSYQNSFAVDPTFSFCLPSGSTESSVAAIFTEVLVNIPLLVLGFCYISIFFIILRIQRHSKVFFKTHIHLRALLLIIGYFICYFPKFFGTLWRLCTNTHPPFVFYILMPLGLTLVMIFNPFLVLFLNHRVHQETIAIFYPPSPEITAVL
ncbi:Melatonin receptor type 1B [Entomophthora muscae]|uniref:Melatonin receptor type 1B n=1 Tax=Entomophthora muscae TaxID=34485 RepID=A0ACC2S1G0_9FUNG|nr:Melatonin receptor type 1B [Entomophthora muscae]